MKKIIILLSFISTVLFAQSGPNSAFSFPTLQQRVVMKSLSLKKTLTRNAHLYSRQELQTLNQVLSDALQLARLNSPTQVCAQTRSVKHSMAFEKIFALARSSEGLNMMRNDAREFAQKWVNQYPCVVVDHYVQGFKELKELASSSSGMNMMKSESREYALKHIDHLCSGVHLSREFSHHFEFARSSQGMNMMRTEAREYAQSMLLDSALSCSIFDL